MRSDWKNEEGVTRPAKQGWGETQLWRTREQQVQEIQGEKEPGVSKAQRNRQHGCSRVNRRGRWETRVTRSERSAGPAPAVGRSWDFT